MISILCFMYFKKLNNVNRTLLWCLNLSYWLKFFFWFISIVSIIKNWIIGSFSLIFHWLSRHVHGISAIIPCSTNKESRCVLSGGILIFALFQFSISCGKTITPLTPGNMRFQCCALHGLSVMSYPMCAPME